MITRKQHINNLSKSIEDLSLDPLNEKSSLNKDELSNLEKHLKEMQDELKFIRSLSDDEYNKKYTTLL